jgi:pyridoxamine 5'-phosphate oxidase
MPADDPIAIFQALLAEARSRESFDATAGALATATAQGAPSVRVVLLKDANAEGFAFFTNYGSRKARELDDNPQAALSFHWPVLGVQFRVEGRARRLSRAESEAYFKTRPRESQIGAWASAQSTPLASRNELLSRYKEQEARWAGGEVPCPPHWGGYRLSPDRMEIWRNGDFRLHERTAYTRHPEGWAVQMLYP